MDPVTFTGPSRCLGCVTPILPLPHLCRGNKIPTDELGWWCDCPEPECRRRQAGDWSTKTTRPPKATGAKTRRHRTAPDS
ncbi:hypothetical protein [Micromonospora sp. DT233]|uniref:hypothetical protein n=1 Tax=Micromonospora sp. DT233 TaxID=3393432 RepID=UPI003CEC16AD